MPWTCTSCGAEESDDVAECSGCAAVKTAWSVVVDRTRSMVIARKAVKPLRGTVTVPLEPEEAASTPLDLVETGFARAVPKSQVRLLHERGLLPAPANILYLALHRARETDLTVTVEVIHSDRPTAEVELPREAQPGDGGVVYAPILFVRGEGDLEGVSFPDTSIVDLSEAERGENAFAPTVSLEAIGRPAVELPTQGAASYDLEVLFRLTGAAADEVEDDQYHLVSTDGAFEQTLVYSQTEPHPEGVLLRFCGLVPERSYTLQHLPDADTRAVIFEEVPGRALGPFQPLTNEPTVEERVEEDDASEDELEESGEEALA